MPKNTKQFSNTPELVQQSAYDVMKKAKYVSISDSAIKKFIMIRKPTQNHWLEHYSWLSKISDSDSLLDILFAFNSISFCYWGEPKWSADLGGQQTDGSHLLLMCLREIIYKDKNFLKPKNLMQCGYNEFANMLKGAINLQFVKERHSLFNMLGEVVCDKYSGSYLNMLDKSNGTAPGVLNQIISDFPGFNDSSFYNGTKVYYYKRAQLLVSDINYCLKKGGFSGLSNTNMLTACADYKLPQMLRMFGVLKYKDSLGKKIDLSEEINKDSLEENEIRSATIVAVDMISKAYYRSLGLKITPMNVNDDLWILSQSMSKQTLPYHKIKTTNY